MTRRKNILFAVTFAEKPNDQEMRTGTLSERMDWLNDHGDAVLVVGSLRYNLVENAIGGL